MTKTIVEQLADFTVSTDYASLPPQVSEEAKRIILDSLGCALAATDHPKGRIGVQYGALTGGGSSDATIIGTGERVSVFGAAFANGELINALDYDAVLPPGHVAPYVLPGIFAEAESCGTPGKTVIVAAALAHEMTHRIGRAMDYNRTVKDGKMVLPPVLGYASTMFGASAAISKIRRAPQDMITSALGIAGSISPVNSQCAWIAHAPSPTLKYTSAGVVAQAAMTASYLAELGHFGDARILDDREMGYPQFIGTSRWEPDCITDSLGADWRFPGQQTYKPYPHCRILHAPLDALTEIVEKNDIKPDEIEAIHVWGEAWVLQPVWLNRSIKHVEDAQFSIAHGISVGAHRVGPGKAWQDPGLVFSPSVLGLMDKVQFDTHPDYVGAFTAHPSARPSRVEVTARGTTFTAERSFPKGSPSPDPATAMTTAELEAKFRHNADGVIPATAADTITQAVLGLENVDDFGAVMRAAAPERS